MKIDDLIFIGSFGLPFIKWEFVDKLPEIRRMESTQQNPKWHSEGNVLIHTKMVITALYEIDMFHKLPLYEQKIILVAALFHDIGKPITTKLDEEGNWTSPNHAKVGERVTRELLWDENYDIREKVCHLVHLHMKPKFIDVSKQPIKDVITYSLLIPIEWLYILSMADTMGQIPQEDGVKEESLQRVEYLKEYAIEANVWENCILMTPQTRMKYLNCDDVYPCQIYDNTEFILHIMCGLPGSGKDTFIKNKNTIEKNSVFSNIPIISLDDIRKELKIKEGKGSKKEESKVMELAKERAKEYARNKQSFIWNATSLHKLHRDSLINLLKPYNPYINIMVIESPLDVCRKRREKEIPKEVFQKMIYSFEYPTILECHELNVLQQH